MARVAKPGGRRWLNTEEAAEAIRCSKDKTRELMRRGDLKAVKPAGRWRTTREWCDEYVVNGAAA
ncbi:helix-turn-helix domain-containing protein [Corynebacterium mastitidis]|uniref:DNA-binding protein n=1 Tax=Corynebacterium mastitidis TaxID=161890 RepID=A0A2N0X528_9CORY|nr:DNA-binding protein [Corynebacterium mastitidis]